MGFPDAVLGAAGADGRAGDGAYSWLWTLCELNVGIMTTCMPGMKMFIAWIRKPVDSGEQQEDTIGGGARGGRKMRVELASGVSAGETLEMRGDERAV